jgi:hypothetical protein
LPQLEDRPCCGCTWGRKARAAGGDAQSP